MSDLTPESPAPAADEANKPADEATETAAATTETAPTVEELQAELARTREQSRKWEQRSKANYEAAKRLKEIEDADKTESERLSGQLDDERTARTTAETELAKLRAVLRHGLSEDDMDLIGDGTPDEIDARAARLAERIGAQREAEEESARRKPTPGLGGTGTPGAPPISELVDTLPRL